MDRRRYLTTLGVVATLPGCGRLSGSADETATRRETRGRSGGPDTERLTSTSTDGDGVTPGGNGRTPHETDDRAVIGGRSPSSDGTPTATRSPPTPTPTDGRGVHVVRFAVGELREGDWWQYGVTDVELRESFGRDDTDDRFEMPEDRLLAVAKLSVRNTSDEKSSVALPPVSFEFAGRSVDTAPEFEHPAFDHPVNVADLESVDHQHQFQASGYPVDAGNDGTVWYVAVVPAAAEDAAVDVVAQGRRSSGTTIGLVWSESQ